MKTNLCKQGHDSPRRKNGNCIQCEKERYHTDPKRREYVKAKRIARYADPTLKQKQKEYEKTYQRDKEKSSISQKERYKRNSIFIRLKRLNIEATEIILEYISSHNGCCDICGGPPDGRHKSFVYDHCHTTGIFRGILCNQCNQGIGLLRDSPVILTKAAEYLNHYFEG